MNSRTVALLAFAVGATVANIYYVQPLLADIARAFHLEVTGAGSLATLTQVGTALGMLIFVPLGDSLEKRRLICLMMLGDAAALAAVACSPNLAALCLASLAVGLLSSAVHVLLPFAAALAPPERRGAVVSQVLSGLMIGILLARTFSGVIGAHLGWRAVYALASALMLTLVGAIRFGLPPGPPVVSMSYGQLLGSMVGFVRELPALRQSALLGSLFFASFSAFWTTLVFLLERPPYHYGSQAAGMFGLVGAAGALAAPLVGRLADRYGARNTVGLSMVIVLMSYLVLWWGATGLVPLVVGVLLLDLGVQSGHVSNQIRIYGLVPEARSRLNTVYMVCYFTGASLGSLLGAWAWQRFAWTGVCAAGLIISSLGTAVWIWCRFTDVDHRV